MLTFLYNVHMPKLFKDYLFNKFLEWEKTQPGRRSTYTAYSRYLGIKQQLVSVWMKGTFKPNEENAVKLASKLGDEVYDYLDFPKPDPLLTELQANWDILTDEERSTIEKILTRASNRKNNANGLPSPQNPA